MQSYESGESIQAYIFSYMVLKSSLLQLMALDHLQVVCQPARICGNPSAHLFATRDMAVSVNVCSRLFTAGNRMKPSGHIGAELLIDVQLVGFASPFSGDISECLLQTVCS